MKETKRVARKNRIIVEPGNATLTRSIGAWFGVVLVLVLMAQASGSVWAQRGRFGPDPPPPPGSLKGVPVPLPANLSNYVVDRQAAIVLGKALFWDHQTGSDGLACASCHFHAGADNRVKNQIDPGVRNQLGGALSQTFSLMASNRWNETPAPPGGGPNYTLKKGDFPFHQLADPLDRNSQILYDTDDVVSSQGVFNRDFVNMLPSHKETTSCKDKPSYFSVNGINVRQVEPRNTPTVINAIFNFRNFWDGRANNIFNGRNPFGLRDASAGVDPVNSILVPDAYGNLVPEPVVLPDASLASQATGPILSNFEMSCGGRIFENVGRLLLNPNLKPLAGQTVDPTDSVLAPYRDTAGGLKVGYTALIQKAFDRKYWSSIKMTKDGFTQMEKNFSLFWGVAVMMYESTLVSDNTPFDQYMDGNYWVMTTPQLRGFNVFLNNGGCIFCHRGAEFTGAASEVRVAKQMGAQIEQMLMGDGTVSLYDTSFYNIGVTPPIQDIGLGGSDPFGNPLSWTRVMEKTAATSVDKSQFGLTFLNVPLDNFSIDTCSFQVGPCIPINSKFRDAVDGSFKVPTLRNVELTGPYFHNGSRSTLEQVVEFYKRGGDRRGHDNNDSTGYGANLTNMGPNVFPLTLSVQDQADLVAFLKALTDERVRWEMAPFDHPSLDVPNGHLIDEMAVIENGRTGRAYDQFITIPAVGASGRKAKNLPPLLSFEAGLQ